MPSANWKANKKAILPSSDAPGGTYEIGSRGMSRILLRSVFLLMISAALLAGQAAKGTPGSAGGVKWTAPARWSAEAQRPMRAATYRVPAAAGDAEGGECAVFFFGPGQGGTVDANLERWTSQFQSADGKPVTGKTQRQQVNGVNVTTMDISGTYTASSGPMMAAKTTKPGFRMLAAVLEAPQAPVFIRLTGPSKTVAAAETEFQALVKSVKKE